MFHDSGACQLPFGPVPDTLAATEASIDFPAFENVESLERDGPTEFDVLGK